MTKEQLTAYAIAVAEGIQVPHCTVGMWVTGDRVMKGTAMPDGTIVSLVVSASFRCGTEEGDRDGCNRVSKELSKGLMEKQIDRFCSPEVLGRANEVLVKGRNGVFMRANAIQDFVGDWSVRFTVAGGQSVVPDEAFVQ